MQNHRSAHHLKGAENRDIETSKSESKPNTKTFVSLKDFEGIEVMYCVFRFAFVSHSMPYILNWVQSITISCLQYMTLQDFQTFYSSIFSIFLSIQYSRGQHIKAFDYWWNINTDVSQMLANSPLYWDEWRIKHSLTQTLIQKSIKRSIHLANPIQSLIKDY